MKIQYYLPGDAVYQSKLYPPPEVTDNPIKVYFSKTGETLTQPREVTLKTTEDVIAHYTLSSLHADGIRIIEDSLKVESQNGLHSIQFDSCDTKVNNNASDYASVHPTLLDEDHAGQAINGVKACQNIPGAWNPMSGYKVNRREESIWKLFLPLGMPMVNQRAVTLLHYPPYVAMQGADYLHNMTLERWQKLLTCVGIQESDHWLYDTFLDINPIAAPGSGESEYPNDYFPIMLASAFFDSDNVPGPDGASLSANYIRSMLGELLNPPGVKNNPDRKYTLPLLVGGSPLYDPQATAWFRVRYKDQMPQDANGIPQANIMQAGLIKLDENSDKLTPYMIANHMIAAGVTGMITSNSDKIPDIRKYEGEDLVAAEFLKQYYDNPNIHPDVAKANACKRWFGNSEGTGTPKPPVSTDEINLRAMAITDLFFDAKNIKPYFTFKQAQDAAAKYAEDVFNTTNNPVAPDGVFTEEKTIYTKWNYKWN